MSTVKRDVSAPHLGPSVARNVAQSCTAGQHQGCICVCDSALHSRPTCGKHCRPEGLQHLPQAQQGYLCQLDFTTAREVKGRSTVRLSLPEHVRPHSFVWYFDLATARGEGPEAQQGGCVNTNMASQTLHRTSGVQACECRAPT
eukprot:1159339-Pelagomonas_calceolata.AAC.3